MADGRGCLAPPGISGVFFNNPRVGFTPYLGVRGVRPGDFIGGSYIPPEGDLGLSPGAFLYQVPAGLIVYLTGFIIL